MTRNGWLFGALVAAIVAAVAAVYLHWTAERAAVIGTAALPPGTSARVFAARFPDSSGRQHALGQWRGKTLVVNFWASWCAPCREEMPAFSRLQTRYAGQNVQFVGVAIDTPHNVAAFAQRLPVTYPLLVGETDGPELMRSLGNAGLALPYTLVIDASGAVRLARLGRLGEREVDALLARLLAASNAQK